MKPFDYISPSHWTADRRVLLALSVAASLACGSSTPEPVAPQKAVAAPQPQSKPMPTAKPKPQPVARPTPEPQPEPIMVPAPSPEPIVPAAPINGQVTVRMIGFRNGTGRALIALYTNRKGFPERGERASHKGRARIRNGRAIAVIKNVPPGEFAVAVLHDEDGDKKMRKNFLGIPQEGFGFSRNPTIRFSAPSWKQAALRLGAGKRVRVNVRIQYR